MMTSMTQPDRLRFRTLVRRYFGYALALVGFWISVPSAFTQLPEQVGRFQLEGLGFHGTRLALSGSHLYVAARTNGLQVLDVGDPARVRPLARLAPPDGTGFLDVAVSSNLACLSMGWKGLLFVDIANAAAPVVVGRYPEVPPTDSVDSRTINSVALRDSKVYLSRGYYGYEVLDVAIPSKPVVIASGTNAYALCILPFDRDLVAVTYEYYQTFRPGNQVAEIVSPIYSMEILRLDSQGHLLPVAQMNPRSGLTGKSSVVYRKPFLYLAGEVSGVAAVQVEDPANPLVTRTGNHPMGRRMAMAGNLIVGVGNSGAFVADASNPARPQDWQFFENSVQQVTDVAVGDLAVYAAFLSGEIRIYRRRDFDRKPLTVSTSRPVAGEPRRIRVTGSGYGRVLVHWTPNHVGWYDLEYLPNFTGQAEVLDSDPSAGTRFYRAIWNP
jgi:hypothetical protein